MSASIRGLGILCLLVAFTATAKQDDATSAPASEVLQIRVEGKRVLGEANLERMQFTDTAAGMEEFKRNVITVKRKASIQLTVEAVDARGRITDVTRHRATSYQSLAPSRLSVTATGLVTAAPSSDAQSGLSGDVAVLVIHDDPKRSAWNKVFFNIAP